MAAGSMTMEDVWNILSMEGPVLCPELAWIEQPRLEIPDSDREILPCANWDISGDTVSYYYES